MAIESPIDSATCQNGGSETSTRTNIVMGAKSGKSESPTESVDSATDHIRLTWWDTVEPFVLTMAPGTNNRPIGVFSTFFPARSAQAELNGRFATGQVWAEKRGDRDSSSACLAWSETWVKPR